MLKIERVEKNVLAVAAPIVVVLYHVLFLFLNNVDEASLKDLVDPVWISLLIIAVAMLFFSFLTKDSYKGGILSALLYILAINYKYFEKIIRKISYNIRYWHILPLVILLFCLIVYLTYRYINKEMAGQINAILIFVFAVLILLNVFMNFGSIVQKVSLNKESPASDITDKDVVLGQPNIYYIILDEYSNFDVLKKYYDYDNKVFHDYLTSRGFTVSDHSKNERMNQLTIAITTNYLNLEYVALDTDAFGELLQYRSNPPLFKYLYNYGYSINFHSPEVPIEWNGEYGNSGSGQKGSTTIEGKNFREVFFSNNLFYPFTDRTDDTIDRQKWYDAYHFLLNHIGKENQSQFVYVHTIGGHEPFVFTEDGGIVPPSERENFIDPLYYLGQYKFVTSQIMEALDVILQEDPNSIIILMSDHSMRKSGNINQEDKVTVLNAVYFLGEDMKMINNQSGVNTLRLILDKLFHGNLGTIEVPLI